jgi:hypothetical protein
MNTKTIVAVATMMTLVACGGGSSEAEQTFTESCVAGVATHDFKTTDPTILATVRAYAFGGSDCESSGEDQRVWVTGSIASATCACVGKGLTSMATHASVVFVQ